VTKLSVDHRMPLDQISQLFEDMYGYELNTGTIEEILRRAYTLSEPIAAEIVARLRPAPLVHFDETGLRVAGTLCYLHVASTAELTHLFVHKSRGSAALNDADSVLKDFFGIAVHDCFSSYFSFLQARHVLCGAHLLRELRALLEDGSQWAEKMYNLLLSLYKMPRPLSHADSEQVLLSYRLILEQADAEEPLAQSSPGKRGRPKQSKGRNLLDRLRKHENGVLAFAFEADVPFTNNQAERDLRPAKVKQKISGCFRTLAGAKVYARLQAVISTFRKQEMNVFASLHKVFSCSPVNLARG
jgi:transposase